MPLSNRQLDQLKQLLFAVSNSQAVGLVLPDDLCSDNGANFLLMLGCAVLLDRPILLCKNWQQDIGSKLRAVCNDILDVTEQDTKETLQKAIHERLQRLC